MIIYVWRGCVYLLWVSEGLFRVRLLVYWCVNGIDWVMCGICVNCFICGRIIVIYW